MTTVNNKIIEGWREALIRKATMRLLEQLDNPIMTDMTWDEAEGFVRALLVSYDDILKDKE